MSDAPRPTFSADELRDLVARRRDERLEPPLAAGSPISKSRLSFAQERIWMVEELGVEPGTYTVALVLRLIGSIDVEQLDRALCAIVDRHAVLRGRVEVIDHVPTLAVDEPPATLLGGPSDPGDRLWSTVDDIVRRPFRLQEGGLVRAELLADGDRAHLLVVTLHHLVSDGWSLGLLLRELDAEYGGRPRPETPIQYPDFARWQRERLRGDRLEQLCDHWTYRLDGAPPVLDLPHDRPRGPRARGRGDWVPLRFSERAAHALEQPGATPYIILLAAYALVLSRWSGQTDLVIGSPFAGRDRVEVEELIGCFVNLLPLRIDLSGDPTVAELVDRVRRASLDAQDHAELPFEVLVESLASSRTLAHAPIVQAVLAFQNTPRTDLRLGGVGVEVVPVGTGTSKFDVSVSVSMAGGGWQGVIEYDTDLFDRSTIERFARDLIGVCEQFAHDPTARASTIAIGATEITQRTRHTRLDTPDRCIHQLIEDQTDRTPHAPAVRDRGTTTTYRELDERANALAHHLTAHGARPGTLVAIRLERSTDLVTALLATLKSGAGYLPLDPRHPAERAAAILRDARPVTTVDLTTPLHQLPPAPRPANSAHPTDTAYVIYTSGSTGTPKGVVIEHRNVTNLLHWARHHLGPATTAPWTAFHSYSFDYSVWETFTPLAHGGTTVIVPDDTRDPATYVELLSHEHIAVASLTPSAFRMLTADPDPWHTHPLNLHTIVFGGEALETHHIPSWFHHLTDAALTNMYGITETTVHATAAPGHPHQQPTLGHPIANTGLHLLDHHLTPVPDGTIGEIHLTGAGLARGYLNQPALTAERFIPNPFGPGRLYRTGDLARYRNGDLEYIGRRDRQIKLRGYRIELAEIEHALGDAHVTVHNGQLTAYTRTPHHPHHLRTLLPDHMIPTTTITIDHWPLTPNGKIDHTALPHPTTTTTPTRPPTALADLVTAVVADVLGADRVGANRVGADDDFFALGGDSIAATRLVGRLRADLSLDLSLRDVFEHPTPAGLARMLHAPAVPRRPIEAAGVAGGPMGFAQARLWLVEQVGAGQGTYHVPRVWRLRGPLDRDRLEASIRQLVERHDVLRARFVLRDGEPWMDVVDDVPFELATDPGGWDELHEEIRRPFDLEAGPPFRARMIRLDVDDHLLVLTLHHLVCDGPSMDLIERELGAGWAGRRLPDLPVTFADHARWQRDALDGPHAEELVAFWRRQLADLVPVLALPTDRARPSSPSYRGTRVARSHPAAALRALGGPQATLHMVVFAGLAAALARWSGDTDIAVACPIANRDTPEVDDLIGFFVDTVVVRTSLDGNPSVDELLRRVRTSTLDAHQHAALPFERLVDELAPPRKPGQHPFTQVMCVFQPARPNGLELGGLDVELAPVSTGTAKYDLTLHVEDHGEDVELALIGASDMFDPATLELLADELCAVLADLPTEGMRLDDLGGSEADEDAALLAIIDEHDRGTSRD